ncbi:hypothetical protein BC835DRAFT_1227272, partial [Cytidiella melzeri]
MGGNAFATLLPEASFPRMSPSVYQRLKDRLGTRLRDLYEVVAVPCEAPEKADYGDLDFVVYKPVRGLAQDEISEALCARQAKFEGDRMSYFAVPAEGSGDVTTNVYHQVDLLVCSNKEEFERVMFFNSYGDLGMIIGLLAKAGQLSLGSTGLRLAKPVPTAPPCTLFLSRSFRDILSFFALSLDRWEQGFTTQREVFDWVASSPFFDVWNRMQKDNMQPPGRVGGRPMFRNFLEYARCRRDDGSFQVSSIDINYALSHFRKQNLYNAILHVTHAKQRIKTVFSGKQVEAWTDLRGPSVGIIMEEVK